MSNILTSSKLIDSIKRRGMIPENQVTFTDQDFLNMLNEEIQYFGIPHLLSTHEEYLMTQKDVTIDSDNREYQIPSRAIGNKLRDVAYLDSSNNYYELSRISVEDLSDYNGDTFDDYSETFYVQNNKIVLVDDVVNGGTLRMFFYLKPNTIVAEDKVGIINSIDTVGGVITVSNFPESFSALPNMDFVQANSPNNILSYDITPSSVDITTKTITFDPEDLPSNLKVNDHLSVATETIVPQLPVELHAILCQRVAVAAMEGLGDFEGMQMAQRRLEMMERSTLDIIDNRVEGAPEKINNRHSALRETVMGSNRYRKRGRN